MKASLEAFYNNQFRRDEEVLTILRKREAKIEGNMLKKIEAFKYLYKEVFKEFRRLMKERDRELEDNDVYRRKIWHERLDLINNNLSNLLSLMSELKSAINNVGKRQDQLITYMKIIDDITCKQKEVPPGQKIPDIQIPEFPPCLAIFDLDPPNIIPSKSYKKRK